MEKDSDIKFDNTFDEQLREIYGEYKLWKYGDKIIQQDPSNPDVRANLGKILNKKDGNFDPQTYIGKESAFVRAQFEEQEKRGDYRKKSKKEFLKSTNSNLESILEKFNEEELLGIAKHFELSDYYNLTNSNDVNKMRQILIPTYGASYATQVSDEDIKARFSYLILVKERSVAFTYSEKKDGNIALSRKKLKEGITTNYRNADEEVQEVFGEAILTAYFAKKSAQEKKEKKDKEKEN